MDARYRYLSPPVRFLCALVDLAKRVSAPRWFSWTRTIAASSGEDDGWQLHVYLLRVLRLRVTLDVRWAPASNDLIVLDDDSATRRSSARPHNQRVMLAFIDDADTDHSAFFNRRLSSFDLAGTAPCNRFKFWEVLAMLRVPDSASRLTLVLDDLTELRFSRDELFEDVAW